MSKADDNERFVRLFQERVGILRDGHAGSKTLAALNEHFPSAVPQAPANTSLTTRGLIEIISHEAIVQECYKDSEGIWTWGIGVTNASGHSIDRYKDNPQSLERCIEIFLWLLEKKYVPEVLRAFSGHSLTEAQLTAAVSFHWNTGAIGRATWVEKWKQGDIKGARSGFMDWRIPASIIKRREKEFDLFFAGLWSGDGKSSVIPVSKPSYQPNWKGTKRVDVRPIIEDLRK